MTNLWLTTQELGADWEDSPYAEEAVRSASYILWALSGRKYTGVTTVTERYVRFVPLINTRMLQQEAILNSRVNRALQLVEPWVSPETRIRLRGQAVREIKTVRATNGDIMSPDKYYLVDHSTIQFAEGALIVPADIEITYTYGSEPPVMGKMVAKRLATELLKSWNGHSDCALPERVTSISRQGVSYTLLDSQDFLEEMRLGIYEIDLFLKTVNPNKAQKRSKVFSPDVSRARRYTPKPLKLAVDADFDISVPKLGVGIKSFTLVDVDAEFLESEAGWTLQLVLKSWGADRQKTITDEEYVSLEDGEVTVSISYYDAYSVIQYTDPGTWDLYGEKDGELTPIASGNLSINLN